MLQQLPTVSSASRVAQMRLGEERSAQLIQSTDKLTNHVYSNILLPNNNKNYIRAEYSTTQDIPILGDQQDYKVKISRLKIPMAQVPMFQFKDGAYAMSWGYQPVGVDADRDFTLIGDVQIVQYEQAIAPGNELLQNPPYSRAVFNVNDFLGMINASLEAVWADLITNATVLMGTWDAAEDTPPFFKYDCQDNCIKFVQPTITTDLDYPVIFSGFSCGNGTEQFRLLMSEELYSFLNGFQADLYGVNGVTDTTNGDTFNNLNVGLRFARGELEDLKPIGACPVYALAMTTPQTISSVYAFQRVSRIIITTSLALVKESVLISSEDSGNPQRFEILTDFEIPPLNQVNVNEPIYYYGDDSDRFYNLKDSGPLYVIQIGVYLQWKDGSRTQLYIAPGETLYLKLHFERKLANNQYQISDRNQYSQSGF